MNQNWILKKDSKRINKSTQNFTYLTSSLKYVTNFKLK